MGVLDLSGCGPVEQALISLISWENIFFDCKARSQRQPDIFWAEVMEYLGYVSGSCNQKTAPRPAEL